MGPRVLVAGPDRLDGYLTSYREALREVGASAERAWPSPEALADEARLRRFLLGYDGLLLPGGADVESWRYGEASHPKLGSTDCELDEGQLALARLALGDGLPTLAICRGIQVLGVAVGAPLYQDLPSQRPSTVSHQVREPRDALAHEVEVDPASRLAALSSASRFPVNSRHHQAVAEGETAGRLGSLRVVARAPDGVVEGVEEPEHPFLIGVQWHPENLVRSRPEALGLFRGFFAACESRSRGRRN